MDAAERCQELAEQRRAGQAIPDVVRHRMQEAIDRSNQKGLQFTQAEKNFINTVTQQRSQDSTRETRKQLTHGLLNAIDQYGRTAMKELDDKIVKEYRQPTLLARDLKVGECFVVEDVPTYDDQKKLIQVAWIVVERAGKVLNVQNSHGQHHSLHEERQCWLVSQSDFLTQEQDRS